MTVLVSRHRGKLSRGIVRYVGYLPDKQRQVYVGLELGDGGNIRDLLLAGRRWLLTQ